MDLLPNLLQWFKIFFDKKSASFALSETLRLETLAVLVVVLKMRMSDQQLPEELHKPIIRKFKKKRKYSHLL